MGAEPGLIRKISFGVYIPLVSGGQSPTMLEVWNSGRSFHGEYSFVRELNLERLDETYW